jgi:2-polyprenyl-6-methoxyphenol hydroxylase-like FAD-dependent oxidoreductase
MHTEITGLLRETSKITGVRYQGPEGSGELRAEWTVAWDGRWSIARPEAGLRARGLEALRRDVAELVPEVAESVDTLKSMDDIKHLDVRLNRLRRWHTDGLLCLGDAAHAMSPVGRVGINLAVQGAVTAAALLAESIQQHRVTGRNLAAVPDASVLVCTGAAVGPQPSADVRVWVRGGELPAAQVADGMSAPAWCRCG